MAAADDTAAVRRYGVHRSIVKAGAKEPFGAKSSLAALKVEAEVVKAYLEVVFPCRVPVTEADSEDSLVIREEGAGC